MTKSPQMVAKMVAKIYHLLYVGVSSGALELVEVRAVVADVQQAVKPFACRPKMLLPFTNPAERQVRAVARLQALAMPATPLMELVEDLLS
jgi:hypothetical protein